MLLAFYIWAVYGLHTLVEGNIRELWEVCPEKEAVNTNLSSFSSESLLQCGVECIQQAPCISGHLCENGSGFKTCSLSSDWPSGDCADLPSNNNCSAFKLTYPCKNGGLLNSDGESCTCVDNWYDKYCHRYRYDCSEYSPAVGVTSIQPKNYPYVFPNQLCSAQQHVMVATFQPKLSPGDLNKTFEEYKNGFNLGKGFVKWNGLEAMHAVTKQGEYRLYLKLNAFTNRIAVYDDFKVHSEAQGYAFSFSTFRSDLSNVHDGFTANAFLSSGNLAGQPFSTFDRDPYGCARLHGAGWWYDNVCGPVLYYKPATKTAMWPTTRYTLAVYPTTHFYLQLVEYS